MDNSKNKRKRSGISDMPEYRYALINGQRFVLLPTASEIPDHDRPAICFANGKGGEVKLTLLPDDPDIRPVLGDNTSRDLGPTTKASFDYDEEGIRFAQAVIDEEQGSELLELAKRDFINTVGIELYEDSKTDAGMKNYFVIETAQFILNSKEKTALQMRNHAETMHMLLLESTPNNRRLVGLIDLLKGIKLERVTYPKFQTGAFFVKIVMNFCTDLPTEDLELARLIWLETQIDGIRADYEKNGHLTTESQAIKTSIGEELDRVRSRLSHTMKKIEPTVGESSL